MKQLHIMFEQIFALDAGNIVALRPGSINVAHYSTEIV